MRTATKPHATMFFASKGDSVLERDSSVLMKCAFFFAISFFGISTTILLWRKVLFASFLRLRVLFRLSPKYFAKFFAVLLTMGVILRSELRVRERFSPRIFI